MTENKHTRDLLNPDAEVLTLGEAAKFLRVADVTLRTWMKQGKAPPFSQAVEPGGKILFQKSLLVKWLESRYVPPVEHSEKDKIERTQLDYLHATGVNGIAYQVSRLASCVAFLRCGRALYFFECEQLHDSVLYEFLVHARNMVEFLYAELKDPRTIYATEFVDDPEEWRESHNMGHLPSGLQSMMRDKRIHWMMAHISWKGLEVAVKGGKDKGWNVKAIAEDLLAALEDFMSMAAEDRLYREQFEGALKRLRRELAISNDPDFRTDLRVAILPLEQIEEARARMEVK